MIRGFNKKSQACTIIPDCTIIMVHRVRFENSGYSQSIGHSGQKTQHLCNILQIKMSKSVFELKALFCIILALGLFVIIHFINKEIRKDNKKQEKSISTTQKISTNAISTIETTFLKSNTSTEPM